MGNKTGETRWVRRAPVVLRAEGRVGEIATDLIDRDETPVMFVRAVDQPDPIRLAWERLEARIGALRGRK
jgi:hypothetical protein